MATGGAHVLRWPVRDVLHRPCPGRRMAAAAHRVEPRARGAGDTCPHRVIVHLSDGRLRRRTRRRVRPAPVAAVGRGPRGARRRCRAGGCLPPCPATAPPAAGRNGRRPTPARSSASAPGDCGSPPWPWAAPATDHAPRTRTSCRAASAPLSLARSLLLDLCRCKAGDIVGATAGDYVVGHGW